MRAKTAVARLAGGIAIFVLALVVFTYSRLVKTVAIVESAANYAGLFEDARER